MEVQKGVPEKKETKNEVVLQIPDTDSNPFQQKTELTSTPKGLTNLNVDQNAGKPPKIPSDSTVTRRRSIVRSEFSKPKSRLVEPPHPCDHFNLLGEKSGLKTENLSGRNSPNIRPATPRDDLKSGPVTPRTPFIGTPITEEEDDDEVYQTAHLEVNQNPKKKWRFFILMEWIVFICITGLLIASLTVDKLKNSDIWSLKIWKWCLLVMVIFCGRLVTEWFINFLVFLIEMNFLFKKKVLYFVYGMKKSVQAFIWLALVLLAWGLLFNRGYERSKETTEILNYITRALASSLAGAAIWMVKTLLVKLLSSSFQCSRFFDRIQESIFHQYVLRTLSGPPFMELAERIGKTSSGSQLSFKSLREKKNGSSVEEEVIDIDKLKKIRQEKVSAWTMKGLINVTSSSGLSTVSNSLESVEDYAEQKEQEITSEWEAKAAAYQIFRNVAKPGSKYIEEEDLLRFMKKEVVDNVLPLFKGAVETGKIKRKALKNWLVNVYLERKSLAHSLNDTKTAIEELNRLLSVIVSVIMMILWLLVMGFLTTKILLFISSQLLLVVFVFGNTAKTVFEAIIFVFVMHPFDVGDRCVIDGIQMVVEEMNILTTVFLNYNNEKIFYPNSVLATKPISNFYRSPEMSDAVEFAVDFTTSIESIGALKARIKAYLESKRQYWQPGHSVLVKDIEDMNKMKMGLYVTHTINFQNAGDKGSRRSELVLELKKILEDLDIKYHPLPQEVHLRHVGGSASPTLALIGS